MLIYKQLLFTRTLTRTFFKNLQQKYSQSLFQNKIEELRKMAVPISRPDPIIMKLDSPEFKSIFTEELTSLSSLFQKYGYELRIAGGAVRDLLSGKQPTDLDFATTATPTEMKEMFNTECVRMINMNGEKHGTITPRINDKENFEVTTLRVDVETDGRHAEVKFTTDWLLDSNRRDLTINSMFLGLDGSVYDYFYGYEDLQKRRVAFVGDAATRIREDYLRILRYFRFYGRIAEKPNLHEKNVMDSIKNNVKGLNQISGERIWMELKKILEGNFAGELLMDIIDVGTGPYIGLPPTPNVTELKALWERSKNHNLKGITLISALLKDEKEVLTFHERVKLSAYDRDLALFIVEHREPKLNIKPLLPYQQLLVEKNKIKHAKEWIIEVLKYNNFPNVEEFNNWVPPVFPVSGGVLKEQGTYDGRLLGRILQELRKDWADSEFTLSSEELLKKVPHVVAVIKENRKNKT